MLVEDEQAALMIAREIRRVKYQTQVDLVAIQLHHARKSGDTEAVAELEAALEDLRIMERTGDPRPREDLDRE